MLINIEKGYLATLLLIIPHLVLLLISVFLLFLSLAHTYTHTSHNLPLLHHIIQGKVWGSPKNSFAKQSPSFHEDRISPSSMLHIIFMFNSFINAQQGMCNHLPHTEGFWIHLIYENIKFSTFPLLELSI